MKEMWILILAILFLLALLVGCFPPGRKADNPFRDESGAPLPGSIFEKTSLDTQDGPLGMFLMGQDVSKPVILFCGGGPGIPEYLLEYMYPTGLAREYVVCYLDYRGTCLSYDPDIDSEKMTTQQYLDDIFNVTNYLRDRFRQEKIYLMGHSFGTYIGIKAVQAHPECYQAYISMSQNCNQQRSELLAYDYMLNEYRASGNEKMVKKFESYPIHTDPEAYDRYFSSPLRDKAMHDLGVGTTRNMRSVITGIFFPSLRCTDYTQLERIHLWKGKARSMSFPVVKDSIRFDAFTEADHLDVPIYFFAGFFDYTCSRSLQEAYFEAVKAPSKGFYLFENSAHSPLFEEPERALEVLRDIVENTSARVGN